MASSYRQPGLTEAVAAVLAWLVPGMGHIYLGHRLRGVLILVSIGACFWTGMALGGSMTVDYRSERWWFAADAVTGMHGLAGWRLSERQYAEVERSLRVDPRYRPRDGEEHAQHIARELAIRGLALTHPADNVARAYCGIAGLLNLMCIFDAVMLARIAAHGGPAGSPGSATAGDRPTRGPRLT